MNLMPFQEEPFNGDTFICEEFLKLKQIHSITTAIETGSCLYSTTKWLGENFDKVLTVEVNKEFADHGSEKIKHLLNVGAFIDDSVLFLHKTLPDIPTDESVILFLDAHWNDNCPLLQELSAINLLNTKKPPVIAIHDFYTGNPELGFDSYGGQPFVWDWISPYIQVLENKFGCYYHHFFNTQATGAKRGIVYIQPLTSRL